MNIGGLEVYGIIYKITNLINNKIYIGQTTAGFNRRYSYFGNNDIERVYKYHKHYKDIEGYYNPHLLNAIEKYGFDNFKVDKVFDIAFSKEELDIKEQSWISIYNSFENGYNRCEGGKGSKGKKHTDEWKENHSNIMKGENNPFYGKHHTEETKKKLSKCFKGKTLSEEARNNISKGHIGIEPWNKGKELTQEHKDKVSESVKGLKNGRSNKYKVIDLNGIKVGLLGYTYGLNGYSIPEDMPWLIDVIDEDLIRSDMEKLNKISDVQIVAMHWGTEYVTTVTDEQAYYAKVLNECGAKVDRTCGTHVHFDIADYTVQDMVSFLNLYYKEHTLIDFLLPPSRRDNTYCTQIKKLEIDKMNSRFENGTLEGIRNIADILWTRYRIVNLQSYVKYGTIEFRQHGGTTEFEKIEAWIILMYQMLEAAKGLHIRTGKAVCRTERNFKGFMEIVNLQNTYTEEYLLNRFKHFMEVA